MKAHPEAERFDMLEGEAWAAFVEDIRVNGVREPVVIHDDMILDGRNRWKAAGETGRFVPAVTYEGDDPRGFVISLNVARRHLTTHQRAAYAAELATAAKGFNQHKGEGQSNDGPYPMTIHGAAKALNVSTATVERAKKTMREDPVQHERDKRGEKKAKPAEAAEPASKPAKKVAPTTSKKPRSPMTTTAKKPTTTPLTKKFKTLEGGDSGHPVTIAILTLANDCDSLTVDDIVELLGGSVVQSGEIVAAAFKTLRGFADDYARILAAASEAA